MIAEIPAPELPPPLRLPRVPLPGYRYVPGLQAHPVKDPLGHTFREIRNVPVGRRGTPEDRRFLRGLDLFDHRYYWESHEVLEAVWLELDRGSAFAEVCQGIIQAAASVVNRHRGRVHAADRLAAKATLRLARAAEVPGLVDAGFDAAAIVGALTAFRDGGPWPSTRCSIHPQAART